MLTIRLPRPAETDDAPPPANSAKRSKMAIVVYKCPECFTEYDWEDDAVECCDDDEAEEVGCGGMLLETGEVRCPCCGSTSDSFEDAVDCCMWKTHGPAERRALAQQMRVYGYLLDSALAGVVTETT